MRAGWVGVGRAAGEGAAETGLFGDHGLNVS